MGQWRYDWKYEIYVKFFEIGRFERQEILKR